MRTRYKWAGLALALLLIPATEHIVRALNDQSASGSLAAYAAPSPFAPNVPEKVTLSSGGSASTVSTITGKCLRVSCTAAVSFRAGSGAQTAVADDNQMAASTPETMCLSSTQTTIAFYLASGSGACYVATRGQ